MIHKVVVMCNKQKNKMLFVPMMFFFCFSVYLSAEPSLKLSLSPNNTGQLEPNLAASWDWNSKFGASLSIRSDNSTVYNDESPGSGMEQSYTTINDNIAGEVIPLLANMQTEKMELGVGFGVGVDYFMIRETGFIDLDSAPTRLFFNNVREIVAFKPSLCLVFEAGNQDSIWINTGIGYIPWMNITLNHELSSAAEGTDLDTPITHKKFTGTSTNAWNVNFGFGFRLGAVSIALNSYADGAQYKYGMILIGGGVGKVEIYEIEGRAMLLLSVHNIHINGILPEIGIGVEGRSNVDMSDSNAKPEIERKIRFSVGFKTKK